MRLYSDEDPVRVPQWLISLGKEKDSSSLPTGSSTNLMGKMVSRKRRKFSIRNVKETDKTGRYNNFSPPNHAS
ncbi:MAG: hypothetical protein GY820_05855 [Gammaproteobacteria bacterium]|nr:hypothetical protein [Gammaproteobacteria bacterium]